MARKKIALVAAATLVAAGAIAAVSAHAHRGDGRHDGWHRGHMMRGDADDRRGARGRFGKALTKDEFDARARARFARVDANGDNVIEPAEIEAVVGQRMSRFKDRGRRHGGHMGERMMRVFDGDRDGRVTADEARAEFERRFAEMDLNSDGRIDDADLPPLLRGRNVIAQGEVGMRHRGRHGGKGRLRMLQQADANGDGVVTREEVATLAAREHVRFDRNNDGVVDQADREQLRKEMLDYAVMRFGHRMGAGQDGRVTREEFLAKAAERFARMDLDNDGTISREERRGRGHGWHRGRHHDMGVRDDGGPGRSGDTGGRAPTEPRPGEEPPAKN